MNIKDAQKSFILSCRAEGRSKATIAGYQSALKLFSGYLGNIEVEDITVNHVRGFIAGEFERTSYNPGGQMLSKETVLKRFAVIRTFIRWMKAQGFILDDFAGKMKPPKTGETPPKVLGDEQVKRLFRHLSDAGNFRNTLIFEIFLGTGARLDEVSRLSLNDIDIDDGYIRVLGKGHKEAYIPIDHILRRDIHTYIVRHREAQPGEDALFVNREGYRLTRAGIQIMVRRTLRAIGINEKVGPHILRHTFATNYLKCGGNMEALRQILRHTDVKTTQRYTHLLRGDVQADYLRAQTLRSLWR